MIVFEDELERGKVTPMHLHADVDEAMYVIEGEILLNVEGSERTVGAGGFTFAPRGCAHAFVVTSDRARVLTLQTPGIGQAFYRGASEPAADDAYETVDIARIETSAKENPRGIELLGPSRPVEEVREVHCSDHAQPAVGAAFDELAGEGDGCVEAVAVADDQVHAMRARRGGHRGAFGQAERHRFLDEDVLARCGRQRGLGGMELMRRCDIDHFHLRVSAKLLDGGVGAPLEIGLESLARLRPRVGSGDEAHTRVAGERRRHEAEGAAEPGDADGDCLHPEATIGCPILSRLSISAAW